MTVSIKMNNLKKAMFLKGYNIKELAKNVGISTTYLNLIMKNKKTPSPKMAKRIADALGVEIKEIFEFEIKEA
ncbi:helix-turn-helix transcriptional regulator [Staphylococcus aureus]|uniref:helix-turn-helix transcriptional regulator n=1 Tax=Staphylococcus aureus TaxID=1280 RepID=UPI001888D7BF|nr:helix-turn-helix transcriptional regulator [Staphylococcus aureus]MBF2706239.1 helix-turn-helix transcriptional regulator [Staphylococcus aureus]MBF2722793.1 helix-turn-helix transcriptional regulator [Staphylococcus aureus]MBU6092603.1 helix-turn-helix transcriptional regulator [Staphylococcus aureus]MBU6935484.1 helix-turn-helix transcriptional regulator [Staphylococcus aureus]MBU7224572.1 helix-turn-helix transcriptional regulator [Staphylococcus aureus]